MFFDVGPLELITLAILAVLLFGPDKLPEVIRNVAGVLRKVREISESAKQEVRAELGPGFKDFEFEDLHPRTFVRKHVLDGDGLGLDEIRGALDPRQELSQVADAVRGAAQGGRSAGSDTALPAEALAGPAAHPAFDPDAT